VQSQLPPTDDKNLPKHNILEPTADAVSGQLVALIFLWQVDCAFLLYGLVTYGLVWHTADFQTIPNTSIAQLIQWRVDCLHSYDFWLSRVDRVDW